jgi:thymidylate synthase ThyX
MPFFAELTKGRDPFAMRVTHVSLRPTEAAAQAGCPALTPELLAATGARYSRNNEGLEAILAKIDPQRLDASVDAIFKMIDYGHQSIADMAPVAMFIDGVSLWLAYYVWTLCPTAGGQESSTRYIQLGREGLIDPEILGIPAADRTAWQQAMEDAFAAYQEALADWDRIVQEKPEAARIPDCLHQDPDPKTRKKVERMIRNYNFDRARYFLPLAASTNLMLVMSARGWVTLCQHLCSHPLPEARTLGEAIADRLRFCAPRLIRHACRTDSFVAGIAAEFAEWTTAARHQPDGRFQPGGELEHPVNAYLDVLPAAGVDNAQMAQDLHCHANRYAWFGANLRRTAVRFGYQAVAIAEIRDLNRHRTGNKFCPLVPQGFYAADDEIPADLDAARRRQFHQRREVGRRLNAEALDKLRACDPSYLYWTLLGTQFPFEHTTTADKFIYEAELRTGIGAHYRYAAHLRDSLTLWYQRYPETRGLVLEGTGEPE